MSTLRQSLKPPSTPHPCLSLSRGGDFFWFFRRLVPQNAKHRLNDEGVWLPVSIAFLEQNIYSLFQLMAGLKT